MVERISASNNEFLYFAIQLKIAEKRDDDVTMDL